MTTKGCRLFCFAGIFLAAALGSPVSAADLGEQLRPVAREVAKGAAKGRLHRLAVEPFADPEGNVGRLGRVLATELTAELAADRSIQLIDTQQLATYLEKQKTVLLSSLPQSRLAQAGKALGIDGVVAGSVVETTNQIRLVVKLIAVKKGNLAATARTTMPRSGLLAEIAGQEVDPSTQLQKPDSPVSQNQGNQPPEAMAMIPAGPFLYGEGDQQRTITLPAFWIDLFEVTNGRYAEFRLTEYDPIESHRPAANVSWNQARQFCQSKGRRLPTEQEWEKAARGEDGRLYPWGNAYDPSLLNAESRHSGPTDVGEFEEGRSPYGLYDMAGNVMEWTDSGDGQVKVFRGGSWASAPQDVRATSGGSIAPTHRLPDLGLRCAMDGPR